MELYFHSPYFFLALCLIRQFYLNDYNGNESKPVQEVASRINSSRTTNSTKPNARGVATPPYPPRPLRGRGVRSPRGSSRPNRGNTPPQCFPKHSPLLARPLFSCFRIRMRAHSKRVSLLPAVPLRFAAQPNPGTAPHATFISC